LGFHRWVHLRDVDDSRLTKCDRCGYIAAIEPPWGTSTEAAAYFAVGTGHPLVGGG
jgi:hypothetical protein